MLAIPVAVVLVVGCGGGEVTDPDPPPSDPGPPEEEPEPSLTGTVHPVGQGSPQGLVAVFEYPDGAADTAEVEADGEFYLPEAREADLEIVQQGSGSRRYHPVLLPDTLRPEEPFDVILIPRQWTVQEGRYEGETVDISVNEAVYDTLGRQKGSYWGGNATTVRLTPGGERLPAWGIAIKTWERGQLPADVVFNELGDREEISAEDSAEVWQMLDELESYFGRDFFQPAPFSEDLVDSDGNLDQAGVVAVTLTESDEGRAATLFGEADDSTDTEEFFISASLGDFAGEGAPNVKYVSDPGNLVRITFTERESELLDPDVLVHEFTHAVGPRHVCRWPSVVSFQCPSQARTYPTRFDVAYAEVLFRIVDLEREHDTWLSIVPALIGERVLLLDEPLLPAVEER